MKWNKDVHEMGDKRIVKRFLLFPTCLNGDCRWFENALIEQELGAGLFAFAWYDMCYKEE